MRRIFSGAVAAVLVALGVAACGGSSGPQSLQAYCKDFKPINAKVNADSNNLDPSKSPAEVKAALDDMVKEVQKALDDNPPTSLKNNIQVSLNGLVALRAQLAKVDYNFNKLNGPPAGVSDPKFQKASDAIDAYGLKYCGIKPQNENNNGPNGPPPAAPAPDVVAIQNFQFSTNSVPAGTKVTVKNLDQAPHTVTADDKSFDTNIVNGGASGTFTAPTKPGSYAFHCTVHPDMKGTLTVS